MSQQNNTSGTKSTAYGTWSSVISAKLLVSDSITIDEARQAHDALYCIERRPKEKGRCVIVRYRNGETADMLAAPYSARSRVHEYGGGSYCVTRNTSQQTLIFFVNDSDQQIYMIQQHSLTQVTAAAQRRFADFDYDITRHRLIAVCEQHENDTVTNSLVSIDVASGDISTLQQGQDFYASPRLNKDGSQLCWQSWNHPNMPWDGNRLWLATIEQPGRLGEKTCIAGGDNIATFQPQWSPDDRLYFISDDTGWWQLYRYSDSGSNQQLTQGEKEFGLPQWVFAQSSYAFVNDETIICCYRSNGDSHLAMLRLKQTAPELIELSTPWQQFDSITADDNTISFIAASGTQFPQLVCADYATHDNAGTLPYLPTRTVRHSCSMPVPESWYSPAKKIRFENRHQQPVYANYYPPTNPEHPEPDNTTHRPPPLIVICHGGPSGQAGIALDPKKQFWTSRGFALLDVNYSGSTGYGRDYRLRLEKKWGLLDMQDCCDAALYAVSQGLADRDRLIIRGSSAGGLTVLSALTFEDVFAAGASYYGISELCSLAEHTHKFEAHYTDRLIAPYPEGKTVYQQRSPINSSEKLERPVIFFQGNDDRVVPREQAESMFAALDNKGVCVAAQYFANEQHGFRQAETIMKSLQNELAFYQLVLKLKSVDEISFAGDIEVRNIQP